MKPATGAPSAPELAEGMDGARLFVKRIIDVEVRFVERHGPVATLEGAVACAPGDALVTGTRNEVWPVPRGAFEQKYDAVPPTIMGTAGRYRTRATPVLAMQLAGPLRLALPAGKGILDGAQGDWLVQYAPGDQAIVNGAIFCETYETAA